MSWSIQLIGKPENVSKALEDNSVKLEGQSKVEFDAALPHLKGLVEENFGQNAPIIKLIASGYGFASNGEQVSRNCTCSIEHFYITLV